MTNDVQWLTHLLVESSILNPKHCQILRSRLPKDIDAREFSEILQDYDLCPDKELLKSLLEQALQQDRAGVKPPCNPFATEEERAAAVQTATQTQPSSDASRAVATTPRFENETVAKPAPVARPSTPLETKRPAMQPKSEPARQTVRNPPADVRSVGSSPSALSDATPAFDRPHAAAMPSFDAATIDSEPAARNLLAQALLACQRQGISDLHLSAGSRPFGRKDRQIAYLGSAPLSAAKADLLNKSFLSPRKRQAFEESRDLDYALELGPGARFRINVMQHKDGVAGTYRVVTERIRSLAELGFEATGQIEKLLDYHNGLVLLTGPAGSGKSTTLAALVDYMNEHRTDHIISVEQPIEFVHRSRQCQITQREVGSHTQTFHSALKGALRQDPDIIVIGEMRDLQTIEMAISASETGHLVIGTMHTSDASTTLNRLLDVFPAAQQQQIRAMVSESLRGIICQRLLPGRNGGTHLAAELLISNVAVKNLIRESKIEGLSNVIETGASQGMILMDKSIMKLWQSGAISGSVARANLVSEMLKAQIPA
ncbi:PilT/PilU family type 4a pilus ATPase [Pelagicoccus sp. SDUM812003]|uniref:PilT/PilU family type 4a pilus ATPase n=1 Tax=Pelagicoccus sp. SDUM812003 TaxID=3041267 RepID=UPI00280D3960|nr:PilT/PilU family type 4a pilus ATPase [Pelagicoccus sp. SDUM812003]MDQ8201818.1 PilT/PilU family type 4a pilus ATPase [Pelagicoccus sp. SDUM812003]